MKKIYVFTVVLCLFCAAFVNGQTFYWVGPSGGNWNSAANWSTVSGGPGGAGIPNSDLNSVIFDGNASVNIDIDNIDVSTLTITNSATVRLAAIPGVGGLGSSTLRVNSTSSVTPGLQIDAGSRLEDSCISNTLFDFSFAQGAKGTVNGVWYFTGRNSSNISTFSLPSTTGKGNHLDINNGGAIIFRDNTLIASNNNTGDEYLFFNAGSLLQLDRNAGSITKASYNAASTIKITGAINASPSVNETVEVGNLIFDCAGLLAPTSLALVNINVRGNLDVLNTNGLDLDIVGNGSITTTTISVTIFGNFNISGATTKVAVSNVSATNKTIKLQVNGNLNIGGSSFNLQRSNQVISNTTTLLLKGNFNHTAGTFNTSSPAINNTTALFILELNGTIPQTINSFSQSIDNSGNQVTLRMNNASGASLLTPLSVGRIDFNTTNKGILTTTAGNILTINNLGTQAIVVNGPSNAGFVNGPVNRRVQSLTANTTTFALPTGKGATLRSATVVPSTTAISIYQAEYFNTAFSNLSTISPINGVSNTEYWNVSKVSGADAAIQLSLAAAVPNAQATDFIVVSKYDGFNWVTARGASGTYIIPGNTPTGIVKSEVQSTSGPYTFGFGPQGALAIHLLTFNAKKLSENSAQISWKITENSTPQRFEVMRALDGRNFASIGTVAGSNKTENYEFVDNHLVTGTNYYRLRMIDQDGSITLSNIIAVMNGTKGIMITSMIPTVVTDQARLNISSYNRGSLQLIITDIQGRMIQQQVVGITTGNQEVALNVHALSSGAYQVTGYMNGERTTTIRFIKQ